MTSIRNVTLALSLVLTSGAVWSQTSPARAAFDRGMAEVQAERYGLAATAFEESYRLRPVPVVLFNLAGAYDRMGRVRQAIGTYERYLAEGQTGLSAERVAFVRSALDRLRTQLATVTLLVSPSAFEVEVDGRREAVTDAVLRLDPGAHVLTVTAPAHQPARRELTLRAGAQETMEVSLVPVAALPVVLPPPSSGAPPRESAAPREGVTHRWWFWTGLVVIGAGVTAGVLAATGAFSSEAPPPAGLDYAVEALRAR